MKDMARLTRCSTLALLLGPLIGCTAAPEQDPRVELIADSPSFNELIAANPRVESITTDAVWAEGPVCLADGRLIWSDVKRNSVMSWKEGQDVQTWLAKSDFQNGHALDHDGRVIAASHGQRAIVRREAGGRWRVLVDRYQGKRLNSPNDVVVAADGGIWFSDPTFGLFNEKEGYGGTQEQDGEYVYRYDPLTNSLTRMATPEVHAPNGLAFSPDGDRLYIADSQQAHDFNDESLAHHIVVYDVKDNALSGARVFAEISPGIPDGIKVDENGNVWSSSKEGLQVFSPQGERLGMIRVASSDTGNLTFCSTDDQHWLYITAANQVLRIASKVGGAGR
ncbi:MULTISPECIES: SMP-30/gluconolactonase/LRE family protein [Pseudomonas]|uniref:Gluconolactonase n=2 Tax=Pseudomonadaceae TaxID=135621 RepID=A0A7Y9XIQ7_9GAMM|nr:MULTISPECIES: SMP-30/gluconolactonase/LRE family protein [Pseudomonas]MCW2293299.1 gluconolactonase [Pseudomonas sp. BIGb0408]NYH72130.1 gluconolactonase [Pseudomonas flavescens]